MEIVLKILLTLVSLPISGGVAYVVLKHLTDDMGSGTGAMGQAYGALLASVVTFIAVLIILLALIFTFV